MTSGPQTRTNRFSKNGLPGLANSEPYVKDKTVLHERLQAAHTRRRLREVTQVALHIKRQLLKECGPYPPAAQDAAERQTRSKPDATRQSLMHLARSY